MTQFFERSVANRLVGLCVVLLAGFAISTLLFAYLIRLNQQTQAQENEQYHQFDMVQATQQAIDWYRHVGGEVNTALLRKDHDQEQKLRDVMGQAVAAVYAKLDLVATFDSVRANLVRKEFSLVQPLAESAINAFAQGDIVLAGAFADKMQVHVDLIEKTLHEANTLEHTRADAIEVEAAKLSRRASQTAALVIVFGGVLSLLFMLTVIRSVVRPLQTTTTAIRQVNSGYTHIDLPPVTRDEFGDMAIAIRQFRDTAERLRRLAFFDTLTGLGTRAHLEELLQTEILRCEDAPQVFGLFYLDLDNFSSVNDRLGHKGGDVYLCEAASRLRRFVPVDAQLFRYSGDKFIVLTESLSEFQPHEAQLRAIAEYLLSGMSEPYLNNGRLLNMSVSIGVAVYPADGATPELMLSAAEAAMYAAKSGGRNTVRFAGAVQTGRLRDSLAIATDIRRGLERGEFDVFYQPIVDTEQRRVVAAEALLRWHHPQKGLLLPGQFIAVAEEEGLMAALGEQCLRMAHLQLRQWRREGFQINVSVNLSARQTQSGDVITVLSDLLAIDAEAARLIDLELTESVLFDNSESVRRLLGQIKEMGYRLGMDDFGIGYSSFSYLRRLPIDKIKVDREFVIDLDTSRQSRAIVSALSAIARTLDLDVVAEGIETADQSQWLRAAGCHLQQGFHFAKALPATEFRQWSLDFDQSTQLLPLPAGTPPP